MTPRSWRNTRSLVIGKIIAVAAGQEVAQQNPDTTPGLRRRPTGLHAGQWGRVVAGLLRDHQLRDMP